MPTASERKGGTRPRKRSSGSDQTTGHDGAYTQKFLWSSQGYDWRSPLTPSVMTSAQRSRSESTSRRRLFGDHWPPEGSNAELRGLGYLVDRILDVVNAGKPARANRQADDIEAERPSMRLYL